VILTEKLTLRSSDLGLKGIKIQSTYDVTEIIAFEISPTSQNNMVYTSFFF